MRYYRCKCGKHEATSSMGVADCAGCEDCGTTLEERPADHRPVQPHTWLDPEWKVAPKTGEKWQERRCSRCWKRERVSIFDGTTPIPG